MLIHRVVRPKDTVDVALTKHKNDNKFSYVNLTKEHICTCKFDTAKDALADMDRLISKGKIYLYKYKQDSLKTSCLFNYALFLIYKKKLVVIIFISMRF